MLEILSIDFVKIFKYIYLQVLYNYLMYLIINFLKQIIYFQIFHHYKIQ